MRGLSRLTLTAALIVLPALSRACRASDSAEQSSDIEAVSLKFSWQDGVQFLGFHVTQHHGYFAEEGVEATTITATSS
jgi:ABC-type nitrate/sulfonate/bicarbonate transport system substrate-binding protein